MRKLVLFLISCFIFFFAFANKSSAAGEFDTDINVTYQIHETGVTTVTQQITLTNVFSNLYATTYGLTLEGMDPQNIKAYGDGGIVYNTEVNRSEKKDGSNSVKTVNIKVNFTDAIVGKGKSRNFWIAYEESSFAVRTGEVWEISIPRLSTDNSFNSYYLDLKVPKSLGELAYISPNARQSVSDETNNIYKFNKDDVVQSGIVAGFGQFQVFSFDLNYHLENPLSTTSETEIAIPPDTAFQRMYYTDINPKPSAFYIDDDGNWIAKYILKARQRVDVNAKGSVQIFASQRPYLTPSQESLNNSLLPQEYWESNDLEIQKLGQSLKTPRAIYDFVTDKLKYNYDRVKPNVERLGAQAVLTRPQEAICMEFTDLFIALARAAGIPAREVNGYAYTENPDIQPLSLVNDVLHSWPEYFDQSKNAWIPVDPTWGSTTGGVDFFNKLDLRHFTFVVHGKSSTKPYAAGSYKLGANPQKDVFVSFGKLPDVRVSTPEIKVSFGKWIPFLSNKLNVEVLNPGPVALYTLKPAVYYDGKRVESSITFEALLPYQSAKSSIEIPFSFLAAKTPNVVTVVVDSQRVTANTNKNQVIVYNLLFIFIVVILLVLSVVFRLKHITFAKILTPWKNKS